jgi:anaerobic dimethyl sulfoxide reductase subunit B
MSRIAFSFDVNLCSGCLACVVACQDQNDLDSDIALRRVTTHEQTEDGRTKIASLSLACLHCGDAPCRMVCPTGAIFLREDSGIVDIHRDLCIGCHSCLLACPFGAPQFAADHKMIKCDLCQVRVENDLDPACVRICTTGALKIDAIERVSRQKAEQASRIMLQALFLKSPLV